ncbi:FliH/SctL family protein [Desulfitobacterium sp. Sab5]|uniref:FliH/SctL family protein n=1 Tax=Desulfitobacterium nosdiversum TaxID=3375356 RepID=UPI003CEA7490
MKSFIRQRVVKSQTVEVLIPRLVECKNEEFEHLTNHITVVYQAIEKNAAGESNQNIEENTIQGAENVADPLISEAELKAQAIIEQAQTILAQAQADAEHIRANAQIEADELKKKVSEEAAAQAQAEGYEKGFSQGQAEGMAKVRPEAERKLQETNAILQLAQHAAKEEWSKAETDLVHLALKIAERVVRSSLAITPELLLNQIKALTLFPQSREGWLLHVSPDDFTWLSQADIQAQLQVNCVSNDTLHPGDCFLECSEGIFDARLEVQLDHLEYLLKEELKHGELESASH